MIPFFYKNSTFTVFNFLPIVYSMHKSSKKNYKPYNSYWILFTLCFIIQLIYIYIYPSRITPICKINKFKKFMYSGQIRSNPYIWKLWSNLLKFFSLFKFIVKLHETNKGWNSLCYALTNLNGCMGS